MIRFLPTRQRQTRCAVAQTTLHWQMPKLEMTKPGRNWSPMQGWCQEPSDRGARAFQQGAEIARKCSFHA